MHHDEKVSEIYLIKNGNVRVYNKTYDFILEYVEGSFFGEYQLLFDLLSGCEFIASVPKQDEQQSYNFGCILITISKSIFFDVITDVQNYQSF